MGGAVGSAPLRIPPDRGIIRTFIEVLNQKNEVVMSMKLVNFVRCREHSR